MAFCFVFAGLLVIGAWALLESNSFELGIRERYISCKHNPYNK